nr:hypothetical protein [Bacillus cereus]
MKRYLDRRCWWYEVK